MEGYVCEGSRSNIFMVKNGQLSTPDLECGLRNRPIRNLIMKISENYDIKTFEAFISLKHVVRKNRLSA